MPAASVRTVSMASRLIGIIIASMALVAGIFPVTVLAQLSMVPKPAPVPKATRPPTPTARPSSGFTGNEQARLADAMNRLTPKQRKKLAKEIQRMSPEERRQLVIALKRQMAGGGLGPRSLPRAR